MSIRHIVMWKLASEAPEEKLAQAEEMRIALEGLTRPFGGTFLVFSDYMRPPMRLAAMMKLPIDDTRLGMSQPRPVS